MSEKNKIRATFDGWASSDRSDIMAAGHKHSVETMLLMAKSLSDYHFLDIGCGNGWVVKMIAQDPCCSGAWGVDLSEKMIELAKTRHQSSKEHYRCCDFETAPFDRCFDLILSMEVLYYMHKVPDSLQKIYQLLNPGGAFVMGIDYYQENPMSHSWPEDVALDMTLLSIEQWGNLFLRAGFQDVSTRQVTDPAAAEEWKNQLGTLVVTGKKRK